MTAIKDVTLSGSSLDDLIVAYNEYVSQSHVAEKINNSSNPNSLKATVVDTIMWRQEEFKLREGEEKLSFSKEEAYSTLGIN